MPLNTRLSGPWTLRDGYPAGVPPKDYIPLLALLRRTLTEDEIREIATEIAEVGNGSENGAAEIGVQNTPLTDAMPSPEDIERVEARLAGWPENDAV